MRNLIHNLCNHQQSHYYPAQGGYGAIAYYPPPAMVEAPIVIACPASHLSLPQPTPFPAPLPLDESNKIGASTIRVSSSSGRWQKVGLEIDLPLDERPQFIFNGKSHDSADGKTQGTPLDGIVTVEDNHIRVERTLLADGRHARYTVFFHRAGCGIKDSSTGWLHDGPLSGAGSDKDLIVVTKDGARHLLKLQGDELLNASKPKTDGNVELRLPGAQPDTSTKPPVAPGRNDNVATPLPLPSDKPIPKIVDPVSPPREPLATPRKDIDLVPELLPPLTEPPLPKDPPKAADTKPPPLTAKVTPPPPTPPPDKLVQPAAPPSRQVPVASAFDFSETAARQFVKSQFKETDFTTFDSDDKSNSIKQVDRFTRLELWKQDASRITTMLQKTEMSTLPVGTVLEHRISGTQHRMVLRKFRENVYALDTADTHKSESGDGEGFSSDTCIFVRNESGDWFLLSYGRLATSCHGGLASNMDDRVRTRLTWLGYGAEGTAGHSLKVYSPQHPSSSSFIAPRSTEDPVVNRVPTHGLPFCTVAAGAKDVAPDLPERAERVLTQCMSKLTKPGDRLFFEQCWAHSLYVEKLDDDCLAIHTHEQVRDKKGFTASAFDTMLVRRTKDKKGWEIAQLEFNGTDFVAVSDPGRYLGKDCKYDHRFIMLEAGLNKRK